MELIHKLATPAGLTVGEKFSGGIMVAVVGMTITFLALIFLWLAIEVMAKMLNPNKPKKESAAAPAAAKPAAPAATASVAQPAEQDDSELVSVITAAVATAMNTSINNIVVSKIVRVSDERPAWSKIGLIEQMNNRF